MMETEKNYYDQVFSEVGTRVWYSAVLSELAGRSGVSEMEDNGKSAKAVVPLKILSKRSKDYISNA